MVHLSRGRWPAADQLVPPTPPAKLKVETLRRNELQFALTYDTLSRLSFSSNSSLFSHSFRKTIRDRGFEPMEALGLTSKRY